MNIESPIVAAHSLGGIVLGSDVKLALAQSYAEGRDVRMTVYDNPGIKLHSYAIDQGVLTINADEQGVIVSLSCQPPYRGTYKNKLWPGMSLAHIMAATQKQMLTCGALVLDGELGVYFVLPSPYDEFNYVQELPPDLILNTIYVMQRGWRGY